MCEIGDIILIKNYIDNGKNISRHSFVVISNDSGQIQGLDYDIICNVLSSFKDEEHRKRKLGYPGNFEISHEDTDVPTGNNKDGYIKAEQFYFFNLDKIDYMVIGKLQLEVLKKLLKFTVGLGVTFIIDNLLTNE